MPKRSGTASNSNAPVESTITSLSTGAGGILIGTDPVAMMIFFARYFSLFPLASKTETSLLPEIVPIPFNESTLFAANKPLMP